MRFGLPAPFSSLSLIGLAIDYSTLFAQKTVAVEFAEDVDTS